MIFCQVFKKIAKIPIYLSAPISYKTAFAISFLIHGLAVGILTFLIHPLEYPDLKETPLVIDFVSAPRGEEHRTSLEINNKNALQPDQLDNFVPSTSIAIGSKKRLWESELSTILENENDNSTNQEPKASQELNQKQESKSNQPYFARVIVQPSLNFPRIDMAEPKLLPAKMPISERDEKILLRKIKKLAENLPEWGPRDTTIIVENGNQLFEVQIQHHPAMTSTELDEVSIHITAEDDGNKLSNHLRMRRLAFSNFAQLVDYWDPQVAVHNDELEGRFHSNYAFAISRSGGVGPKFRGKVTTAAYDIKTSGNFPIIDHSSIFIEGIETGVKQIRLPINFSKFFDHSKLNPDEIHHFKEETWLIFQQDGSFTWKSKSSPTIEHRKEIQTPAFFIIGDQGAKIHVKGTVKGKILVYSGDHIIIDDDLFYAHPPDKFTNSDDYLGLVSEKNIEIAPPSITGSDDLHIYAAIYAKGWFRIPNLKGNGEATLYIYGSLSAGCLSATEPRYATHIRFDKRLETHRPPNFPVTEYYEIVEWEKEWEVKKN